MSKSSSGAQPTRTRRGRPPSRSLEEAGNSTPLVGLRLLQAIATGAEPETLTQIAQRTNLSVSRAFRYLKGMTLAGFLNHNEETGKYTIGAAAIELGLAAMSKVDAVDMAATIMRAMTKEAQLACSLSIWGPRGPTVIRTEHPDLQITVRIREGTILSLPITAVGRIFLTYMPPGETAATLKQDLETWNSTALKAQRLTKQAVQSIQSDVRARGLATVTGLRSKGLAAIAAPVFGPHRQLKMCLALVGIAGSFDSNYSGPVAGSLKKSAAKLTKMLGGPPPE